MKANITKAILAVFSVCTINLFLIQNLNAGIVYKDINPDITKSSNGIVNLDIDDDGLNDFQLEMNILGLKDAWIIIHANDGNKIAMNDWHIRLYEQNDNINDSAAWINEENMPLAYLTSGETEGPWPGRKNAYLGMQFKMNGKVHFGWLHIEVLENAKGLTVMELAYEDVAGKSIFAGDKTQTLNIKTPIANQPVFYLNNKILHIARAEKMLFDNVLVSDLSGRIMLYKAIKDNAENINLNSLKEGVYILTLNCKNKSFTRKIYLH